jgi:hypothetical protein
MRSEALDSMVIKSLNVPRTKMPALLAWRNVYKCIALNLGILKKAPFRGLHALGFPMEAEAAAPPAPPPAGDAPGAGSEAGDLRVPGEGAGAGGVGDTEEADRRTALSAPLAAKLADSRPGTKNELLQCSSAGLGLATHFSCEASEFKVQSETPVGVFSPPRKVHAGGVWPAETRGRPEGVAPV